MKKMRKVCIISGIAISKICKGFSRITLPWNENNSIKVNSNPMVVMPSNFFTKVPSKYSLLFALVTITRVIIPPASGTTTKSTTDKIKVFQGTVTLDTPSRNFTIGINATRIIKSFVAT